MRLDWQRRAVVLFAAFLLILSVILVVFALREAEREKLLKESEFERERQQLIETVVARAESLIDGAEERLLQALGQDVSGEEPDQLAAVADDFAQREALVSEIFRVDGEGRIQFLTSRPLFLLPGEMRGQSDVLPDRGRLERWQEAEDAEFRLKDFSRAVSLYRGLASGTSDQDLRALLLNRLGRCYAKWGRPASAVAAYREQLELGPPEAASDGIPLGITALLQIGNIHHRRGEREEAGAAFLELYQGLMESRWPLARNQFEFFMRQTRERLGELIETSDSPSVADVRDHLQKLNESESRRLLETRLLENIQERIVPLMRLEARDFDPDSREFKRASESTDSGLLLVSFSLLEDESIFGILLDREILAQGLLTAEPGKSRLKEGFSVAIVDDTGAVVEVEGQAEKVEPGGMEGGQPAFTGVFTDSFPPWEIRVFQSGVGAVEKQFLLRRNVYILTLAVVILALSFGGYLAIRSTAKELKLARLKSDFVATVSHEFRTPLTSIRYMAELLQRGRVPQAERRQKYYETITGESERLSRLVENLLDFSKIEAGMKEYRMEETDIAAVAADTASRFRQQAALQEFRLETEIAEGMPVIRADKDSLSRAIFNLLDNAVKYSGEKPRVVLRAWSGEDQIFLQVEDEGIGISVAEQKRIFEKFYRSNRALEGNIKGSGIGLPLVEHIVRAHGGKVLLESEPGKGTRVTIELPVQLAEEMKGEDDG